MEAIDLKGKLGAELRRRRLDLGLSQEELAERAALHRTYVSDVEAGKRNLSLASIQRLTEALGASVSAVFTSVDAAPKTGSADGELDGETRVASFLLAEDDPASVRATLSAFKAARLANVLEVVRNGEEALDFIFCRGAHAARKLEDRPQMVILGLHLPQVNGLEVLRRIKADPRTRRIPVVVLTNSAKDRHNREALQLGAAACLVKPVDFKAFSELASELNFRWALLTPPERGPR